MSYMFVLKPPFWQRQQQSQFDFFHDNVFWVLRFLKNASTSLDQGLKYMFEKTKKSTSFFTAGGTFSYAVAQSEAVYRLQDEADDWEKGLRASTGSEMAGAVCCRKSGRYPVGLEKCLAAVGKYFVASFILVFLWGRWVPRAAWNLFCVLLWVFHLISLCLWCLLFVSVQNSTGWLGIHQATEVTWSTPESCHRPKYFEYGKPLAVPRNQNLDCFGISCTFCQKDVRHLNCCLQLARPSDRDLPSDPGYQPP